MWCWLCSLFPYGALPPSIPLPTSSLLLAVALPSFFLQAARTRLVASGFHFPGRPFLFFASALVPWIHKQFGSCSRMTGVCRATHTVYFFRTHMYHTFFYLFWLRFWFPIPILSSYSPVLSHVPLVFGLSLHSPFIHFIHLPPSISSLIFYCVSQSPFVSQPFPLSHTHTSSS